MEVKKDAVAREKMNIVMVGHVDHGKSTIVGRLLADTHSLPEGKLEQVKKTCERNSKPFEYAFLIDALKDEQAQGITIDSARVFFKTRTRDYIIIDAPGHIEFLKNMVTGASRAEAALLVIDAQEGVQENSRRHGYMLSMLGIKQVAILINKMDLVAWDEEVFNRVREEYSNFLSHLNMKVPAISPLAVARVTMSPFPAVRWGGIREKPFSKYSMDSRRIDLRWISHSGCQFRLSINSPTLMIRDELWRGWWRREGSDPVMKSSFSPPARKAESKRSRRLTNPHHTKRWPDVQQGSPCKNRSTSREERWPQNWASQSPESPQGLRRASSGWEGIRWSKGRNIS